MTWYYKKNLILWICVAGVVQWLEYNLAKVGMGVRFSSLAPLRNLFGKSELTYMNHLKEWFFCVYKSSIQKRKDGENNETI